MGGSFLITFHLPVALHSLPLPFSEPYHPTTQHCTISCNATPYHILHNAIPCYTILRPQAAQDLQQRVVERLEVNGMYRCSEREWWCIDDTLVGKHGCGVGKA